MRRQMEVCRRIMASYNIVMRSGGGVYIIILFLVGVS
jgi:hypothetical protein